MPPDGPTIAPQGADKHLTHSLLPLEDSTMKRLALIGMVVCALAAFAAPASATSFEFNIDHCSGTCGGGPYGTIALSQFATDDVLVDVTLDPAVIGYVSTGFPGS